MHSPKKLRIFFSSPGDVKMERETARKIVGRLQQEAGDAISIEPYFWEHEAMSATRDYQQNIPEMSAFDVVVCMLWSRLGTPLHPERHPRPDGGFFESGTEYEFFTALSAFKANGTPNILVFRNFTEPRRPSRPKEAREAADRELDRLDHFFERYFQDGNFFTAAVNEYRTLGEFEDKLSLGLRSYLLEHVGIQESGAKRVARYSGQPYLGLSAFDFDDAQVFYGRTAQVGAVIESLQVQEMEAAGSPDASRRFVLLLGASGSGKSSLARAGVLPMLIQPGVIEGAQLWRRCVCKPGDAQGDPLLSLATALLHECALPELATDGTTAAELASMMRLQPAGAGMMVRQALSQAAVVEKGRIEQELRDELRRLEAENRMEDVAEMREKLAALTAPVTRLALVVDQLEELFTTELATDHVRLVIEVLQSLAMNGRVYLIATLRSDFYARCLEHPLLVDLMKGNGSFALPQPGPGDLAQMIRQPAVTAGLEFEENASSGDKLDDMIRDAALRDPSALPLLSYTLEQLYEKRNADGVMTIAAYQELGGLEGAIGGRAEQTYRSLSSEAQMAFDDVWRRLVTLSDDGTPVRRRVRMKSLPDHPAAKELVDAFITARLLTADQGADGESTLSVAHEALLKHWPRVTQWLEGNRDFLRVRSRIGTRLGEWEEHQRADDYLIPSGTALAEAEQILAKYGQALESSEVDYISRSVAFAKAREQAKLRKARAVAAGALVLSLIAVAGGIFAWNERGKAQRNSIIALQQKAAAEKAESQAKASQVRADYTQGIDMLDAGQTRKGLTSLMQVLKAAPDHEAVRRRLYSYHLYGLPKAIPIRSVQAPALSRQRISGARFGENQRCAYLSKDHTLEVFDLNERKVIHGPWEKEPDSFAGLISDYNQFVMNIRQDSSCRIWYLDTNKESAVVKLDPDFSTLTISHDGSTLLLGRNSGKVTVWDTATGEVRHEFQQKGAINNISIDSSGTYIAVASDELVFYNLKTLQELKRHEKEGLCARTAVFSGDGKVVVVHFNSSARDGSGSRFAFFTPETGEILESRDIEVPSEVFNFNVNHDGTAIIVASFATNARVYHRTDAAEDRWYPFDTYPVKVLFSPDELLVIAADSEGTVKIFDAASGKAAVAADKDHAAQAEIPARLAFEPISHEGRLEDLLVSWDGHYLMSCTASQARIWDLSVGRALTQPVVREGESFDTRFVSDDREIIMAGSWGIQRYDARLMEKSGEPLLADANAVNISLGDKEQRALAQTDKHTVRCVDLKNPEKTPVVFNSPSEITQMILSPDELHFGVRTAEGLVVVDALTGKPSGPVHPLAAGATVLRFSGDSRQLIAIQTYDIHSLSVADGKATKLRHRDQVVFSIFIGDARAQFLAAFAISSGSKSEFMTMVWDLSRIDQPPMELPHDDLVYVAGFSDDAGLIVTGTRNQTAQVWDRNTGAMLGAPLFHKENAVKKVAFSHDSRWVATVSATDSDGDLIRVWDWQTGREVSERISTEGIVKSLAFTRDDNMIMAASSALSDPRRIYCRIWELAPSKEEPVDLYALTEATVARNLNEQGSYSGTDPYLSWERVRAATPKSWFLQDPARRSVSPNIHSNAMRWITDNNVPSSQASRAMPAVGLVRAAVGYWENNGLVDRVNAWEKTDKESAASKAERLSLVALYNKVAQLRQAAERNAMRDADVCYYLGMAEKKLTDYQAARKWTLQALKLEPDREDIQILANDVLFLSKDPGVLAQVLDALCKKHPDNGSFLARKGFLLADKGDKAASQAVLQSALKCEDLSLVDRSFIHCLSGNPQEAGKLLDDYEEIKKKADSSYTPESTLRLYQIIARQLAGDPQAAIDSFRNLVAANGNLANEATIRSFDIPNELVGVLLQVQQATLEKFPDLENKPAE
jgi:WD40 repeat protein/tetratricopeptide (TPR) repeat protein